MKKIFIAIVALAAATACSNSEIVSVNREAIGFDNAFVNNSVRSVEDPSLTTDALKAADKGFGVYGFVTGDATAPIFSNEKVYWADNAWKHDNVQYWIADATYNFAAVAPYNAYTNVTAATTGLSLQFTNDGTTDLIYAQPAAITGLESGNTAVAFDFRHVLSKVKFSFLNNYNATNSFLRVSNIKIENAYLTATAELNANTAWTSHLNTLELSFGNANTTSTSTDAVKFAKDAEVESHNELLLIPGAVPSFVKDNKSVNGYKVTFTVEVLVGDTVIMTYNHVAAANFTPVAGCSYDIKATLSHTNLDPEQAQEPIEFTVTNIGGWDVDADGTNHGTHDVVM